MSGINKVFLAVHVGIEPDLRKIAQNVLVALFPLSTSEIISKNNKQTEITEWHNIVMWRGLAKMAGKLLCKGKLIYLEGKVRTRSYEIYLS